jgi:iron(III) transport system ATP-binding protein
MSTTGGPGRLTYGGPQFVFRRFACIFLGVPNLGVMPAVRIPVALGAAARNLQVEGVTKCFGTSQVLRGADLAVPAGSIMALLGPSGCGKTTLLRCIAGLERNEGGRVRVGSRCVSGEGTFVPPEKRRIGMVFQDWALFPHLTVARNVGFGLSKEQRRSGRIAEALEMVRLSSYADRMPNTLSGGQQQRVALARALANRPEIVLLDEPFSNLDATLRVRIRTQVQRLLQDLGVTALFVTHDQEEAFAVGEAVAVMFEGRIVQQARPAELYESPATREVAAFIGDANFVAGESAAGQAITAIGPIAVRNGSAGPVDLLLRPEHLVVRAGDLATVEDIEFYGHDAVYIVRPDVGSELRVRILAAPEFRPGDRVEVQYGGGPAVTFPRT